MKNFVLSIEDTKHDEFVKWCEINNIKPEEFISKAFIEKYTLAKYGDLNEKLNKPEAKKEEKSKTSRKKKDGDEIEKVIVEVKKEEEVKEEKPVKKTRIIKTK